MRPVVFLIVILSFSLFAQQNVKGKISADATWTGQIRVTGDVIVPKGVTLTIAPGAQILMAARQDDMSSGKNPDRVEITVSGKLLARGTKGQGRILFTSDNAQPQMSDWMGIAFKNPREQSILQYCTVEYGYKGITTYGSSPQVIDCEVRYNEYAGISGEVRSKPLIQNCNINSNGFAGVISELASFPVVERSIITQNEIGVIIFDRSEIDLGRSNPGASESIGANYIFNNFENNIYNRSSQNVYAQNNLWNMNDNSEIQATLYGQQQNSGYGEIVFDPIFDDTGTAGALASRNERRESRNTSTQPIAQAPPQNTRTNTPAETRDNTQTLAANTPTENTRLNNSANTRENVNNTASNTPSNTPTTTRPVENTPTRSTPPVATNQQPDNSAPEQPASGTPQAGSVEYLADRSNESNAVQSLINSDKPAGNPLADLVGSSTPSPTNTAQPQITEPIIEGLLDSGSREYVNKALPVYPEIYKRTGHEGKELIEVIVA
ncbi:MAG TPA: NosD domain-containing protein, partial [Calditrichia bacterium]|nr:NosD domain-containing protein [Calditrichia bacterium]